jgi:hypothetical protein
MCRQESVRVRLADRGRDSLRFPNRARRLSTWHPNRSRDIDVTFPSPGLDDSAAQTMHKFYLGQPVQYRPPSGMCAPHGAYVVTAKLPERDGEFEYRIRNMNEEHGRMVRESQLRALRDGESI